MSLNKSLAIAICLATAAGCAQTPQKDVADDTGRSWWSFGSSDTKPATAQQVTTSADKADTADVKHWYWPFGSDGAAAKAETSPQPTVAVKPAAPAVAKADSDSKWWWPFGGDSAKQADQPKTAAVVIDPKVTKAWLDDYEPRLRVAIKDSPFELERREDLLVITAPVDSSFNPNRPALLLPVTLGPITRLAKLVEGDPKTAVLVLGHGDAVGGADLTQQISQQRAQSVAAIFRLSGLERNRLSLRGMGSAMPRAANDSVQGRALNRRIEIFMTPQNTMSVLMAKYEIPQAPTLAAVQSAQAAPAAVAPAAAKPAVKAPAKAAAGKKAAPSTAKAPATKKAAAAKKAAPAKAAPAKTATKATGDQASSN